MTQLEEYEELVEAIVSSQRYEIGAIFKSQCPYSQWTVCIDGQHVEFYNSPAEAKVACARANARAVLAVITERAKEPTEKMKRDGDLSGVRSELVWRAMFSRSPLVKPEDPK